MNKNYTLSLLEENTAYNLIEKNLTPHTTLSLPPFKGIRFIYSFSGTVQINISGERLNICTHEYTVIPPAEGLVISTMETSDICILSVNSEYLSLISDETLDFSTCFTKENINKTKVFSNMVENNHLMRAFLIRYITDSHTKPLGYISYLNSVVNIFCIFAARNMNISETKKKNNQKLDIDAIFMYIKSHISEEITLDRLAEDLFFNKYYICHEFKKKAGISLYKYIIQKKLAHSKTLISQGLPVKEVYKQCGFGGYAHFIRSFKVEYGVTPKEYYKGLTGNFELS